MASVQRCSMTQRSMTTCTVSLSIRKQLISTSSRTSFLSHRHSFTSKPQLSTQRNITVLSKTNSNSILPRSNALRRRHIRNLATMVSTKPPFPTQINLTGKTAIVTGSNSGLGFETSRQLLALKASKVILAVRNVSAGEEAAAKLKTEAESNAEIKVMHLDLEDYESVVGFAAKVKKELDALDILVLNAGIQQFNFAKSKNGHESQMQTNYYSHALLALELLPLLKETAKKTGEPSRLTMVSSIMHHGHMITAKNVKDSTPLIDQLDDESTYIGPARYPDSKLCVTSFVEDLASRVSSDEVIINAVCPGFAKSDIDSNFPAGIKQMMQAGRKLLASSSADGARSFIEGAVVRGPESHGDFISSAESAKKPSFLETPEGKEFKSRIWTETIAEAKKADSNLVVTF